MEVEKQVCSLELAKKLKELGVRQESYFWWTHCWYKRLDKYEKEWIIDHECYGPEKGKVKISAFTVAELGEMLPSHLYIDKVGEPRTLFTVKHMGGDSWHCGFLINREWFEGCQTAKTEADARAKMLIYLLKQGRREY